MRAAADTTTSRETLVGSVERVTFHNEENGFAVLKVKARGKRDLVTVVGHAASISAGEFIHAVGVWTTDRTHGLQFKADLLKTTPPTTAEGIEKYLGSGMVRGIGPKLAKKNRRRVRDRNLRNYRSDPREAEGCVGDRRAPRGKNRRRLGRAEGRSRHHGVFAFPWCWNVARGAHLQDLWP